MSSIDCGRQLEHTLSLLLCWLKIYLRTLPLETPISFFHGCKSLEKSGIMIPPPRSGDYRILFKLSSLLHLSIESIQTLLLLSIIRDLPKDSTRVMKMGIMIPLISSGDYPFFSKLFSPSPLCLELKIIPDFICISQDIHPLVSTPSMRFASPNHEAKDFFSTSLYLGLIVTISYFPEVFVEMSLTHFEVVCGMWLVCLCLRLSLAYLLKLSLFVASLCFFKIFVTCFIFENFVNLPLWDMME
ncbi:hypothetical protein AtEden1_Chr3g0198191 [Arabidopsis thaliana]